MKRYKLRTLQNSDGSSTDYMVVYPDGAWVKWHNANEMRAALIYIIEQADTLEDAVATAREIINMVDGEDK
jgi:hypothetical protein